MLPTACDGNEVSARLAGPLATDPPVVYLEPWQGQGYELAVEVVDRAAFVSAYSCEDSDRAL